MDEYKSYILSRYDEYLYKTEKRGASYGEISYIDNLDDKGLKALDKALQKEGF